MKTNLTGKHSLDVMLNLAKFHREHEKFYAQAPLRTAIELQQASKTLKTLADRWTWVEPQEALSGNAFAGCDDLNETAAVQHDGVLFMEGEREPAEIERLKRDLAIVADDFSETGEWLSRAMDASWQVVRGLIDILPLADVLGERHRIIANDWQAAHLSTLVAHLLRRALDVLGQVDFSPETVRADLAGSRFFAQYLYSAAELVDRAADLAAESATLIHDNERRWRVFRRQAERLGAARASGVARQQSSNGDSQKGTLAATLKAALDQHPMTADADIQVQERNGVITLRGSIGSADKAQVALDIVYAEKGVREVTNDLVIENGA
jgi:hypothetical protein